MSTKLRDKRFWQDEDLSAVAPLVAALTDATIRAARRAAERAGGRLDPPLPVVLDEAANICRIGDLPQRQYVTAGEERRVCRCFLLRRSYRDQNGAPRNETLANLSALPDHVIGALAKMLKGATLVDADDAFEVERSVPHGNVAAAHVMASRLSLRELPGPACAQRDIAYALIPSRAVRPESKLSTAGWWAAGDTTLGTDLGIAGAGTDDVYAAMDWLVSRQRDIERRLAGRHLPAGGIAMFDLSSSWVEGSCCELAAYGYSRDSMRGRKQIEYGCSPALRAAPSPSRYSPGTPATPSRSRPRSPGSGRTSASRL